MQPPILPKRIARNSVYHFLAQVISKGLFFLTTVYLARALGATQYGQFAFAYGLVTLLSVISKFGLDLLTSSEVGEKPERASQYLTSSLTLRFMLSLVLIILLWILVPWFRKPAEVNHLIVLLAIAIAFQTMAGAATSLFEAFQSFGFRSLLSLCMFGFIFVAVWLLNHRRPDLITTGYAFAGASIAYAVLAIALCQWKITKFSWPPSASFLWQLLQMALPLGLSEIFIGIYYRADTVLLSLLDTDAVVGWYDAAYTFVYGLRLIPVSVAMVLLPGFSRTFAEKPELGIHYYRMAVRYSSIAGFFLTFILAAYSGFFVRIVFGAQYQPSAAVLPVLIWTCAIMFINAFQGIFLVVSRERNAFFRATAVGAFSNIAFNLLLIPRYSMLGAAWATVLSEFLVFLVSAQSLSRFVKWKELLGSIAIPGTAIFLIGIVWIYLKLTPNVGAGIFVFAFYFLIVGGWYFLRKPGSDFDRYVGTM